MFTWYLAPTSIGYLTQFILGLAITVYLSSRLRKGENRQTPTALLTAVFAVATVFVGSLFWETAVLPTPRLYVVYLENTLLGVLLVLLFQFAYRFPSPLPCSKWEAYGAWGASLGYTLYEALFAVYRFYLLFGQATVEYRPPEVDYVLTALFLWIPVVFLRQTVASDERTQSGVNWLRKLWKPQGLKAQGARMFALTFILLLGLSIINVLDGFSVIPTTLYSASLALGGLFAIWLFATVYLSYLPENTSFLVKLSGITLTLLLAVLGLMGWAVAPVYVDAYRPVISDHQTLHFTPDDLGGYTVVQVPFRFETDLGSRLAVTSYKELRNAQVKFTFPFYDKTYTEIYVTSVGILSMGQKLYHPNLQNESAYFPGIFSLLIDMDPTRGGGVFARVDSGRLIATWDHLPAINNPEAIFTFQTILYADGSFDMTYHGLPAPFMFHSDAQASANPWLRGVTPGRAEAVETVNDLSQLTQIKPQGALQNFYLDFRQYLHRFIAPLGWLIVGSSLLIIVGFPFLINSSLVRPLNALLAGVKQVESGNLNVEMPIQNRDEIGSLTASFRAMVAQLRAYVTDLEGRVTERTQELRTANTQLKLEAHEREVAETQIIQQQRDLAAAEERERMARDLHDSFGQVVGYVNVQAQATQTLLEKGHMEAAQKNLQQLVERTQNTHADLRQYILGLRESISPQHNLYEVLRMYLNSFHQTWGIETVFSPPQSEIPVLPPTIETQLFHIVQEALVNIRKHAGARRVEVFITLRPDEMMLMIGDDGHGFDPQLVPGAKEEHFGLSIMRERAEQVGGQLEIRSVIGRGTQVFVHIPYISAQLPAEKPNNVYSLRILLVDDQPLFLDGMRNLLAARGLTVIGAAQDGLEAIEQVRALRPDVVLMDVQMPKCDGIQAMRLIKAEFPEIKVVLLTVSEDDEHLLDAIKYGASSYLLKSLDANDLFASLDGLARGEIQIAPGLASRLWGDFNRAGAAIQAETAREEPIPGELTLRQWEVLRLVARGLTYKEAGHELNVTEQAIKYHMAQILERLQLKNREHAVAYARQVQESRKKKQ